MVSLSLINGFRADLVHVHVTIFFSDGLGRKEIGVCDPDLRSGSIRINLDEFRISAVARIVCIVLALFLHMVI